MIAVNADPAVRREELIRRWNELAADPESPDYFELNQFGPDVCVEVLSPSNTREEIAMKAGAYLRGGASEVVVVGLKGEVEYLGSEGEREASALGIKLALPPELF